MKEEEPSFSHISLTNYKLTWHHIPQNCNLHQQCYDPQIMDSWSCDHSRETEGLFPLRKICHMTLSHQSKWTQSTGSQLFLKINFNAILPRTLWFSKRSSFMFSNQYFIDISDLFHHATCPGHLIFLNFVILIFSGTKINMYHSLLQVQY